MGSRQFLLVRKQDGTMRPLFSSGSEMRSAGCVGPNGMLFRPGPASGPLGQVKLNRGDVQHDDGPNTDMDGGAFPGISIRCSHASRFRRGPELPCYRNPQRAPLLLRRCVSSKNEEARRDRYRFIVRLQGPIPCGRSPNRRKAEEYLSRLLSAPVCSEHLRFRGPVE